MRPNFNGVLFFPVTPFTASGAVDIDALSAHLTKGVEAGPGGVFIACGTGEFHALELTEFRAVVRTADRDRFLAALFAPEPARRDLLGLLAFDRELARTPHVTREPLLARIRLQWWQCNSNGTRRSPTTEHGGHRSPSQMHHRQPNG